MAKKTTKKTAKKVARKKPAKKVGSSRAQIEKASLTEPDPIPLDRVLGQARGIEQLEAAMRSERVHHAWIFHGPQGVGKFTAALSWGAMLLDPTTAPGLTGAYACDPDSHAQQLIRAGTHPDLHIVRKELARFSSDASARNSKLSTIPKAVVEQHLVKPASIAAVEQTGSLASKVFIVDEAELLDRSPSNAPVQNAILKTLEEPAPGTVIILVTSSEDRLLPTIRSRCQRVPFAPLSEGEMAEWWGTSGIDAGADERDWLLRAADGSPGRLLALHDGGVYRWFTDIEPMLEAAERGQHPTALGGTMTKLIDDWAAGWVKAGDKLGENRSKDAANRVGVKRMLSLVADRARTGLATPSRTESCLHAIDCVERARTELDTNVQMRLVLEHLAAGLSQPVGQPIG